MNDKDQARELVQKQLDALTDKEYDKKSAASYSNALILFERQQKNHQIRKVLIYKVVQKWREVGISFFEETFPAIAFDYAPQSPIAPRPTDSYDVIFIPLFGFTTAGYRLGHGGGWYDKLLAEQPGALKVGVGIEAGKVIFAQEKHDVPMDIMVTDTNIYQIS